MLADNPHLYKLLHGTLNEAAVAGEMITAAIRHRTEYEQTLVSLAAIAADAYKTAFKNDMDGAFAVPQIADCDPHQILARQIIAAITNDDYALATALISATGPLTETPDNPAAHILAHIGVTARTFHQAICRGDHV